MKAIKLILCAVAAGIFLNTTVCPAQEPVSESEPVSGIADSDKILWYDEPAEADSAHNDWVHALPVGNGRLGAMVFGRTETERLQLNESTIWTGAPIDYSNEQGAAHFDEIRDMMLSGDTSGAASLASKYLMGSPVSQASYQPFVDMYLDFGHETEKTENYRRELDTENSVVSVDYTYGSSTYHRETIASYPDQVIATNITCDNGKNLSFTASLDSPPLEGNHTNQTHKGSGKYFSIETIGDNQISLKARVQDGKTAVHNGGGGKNNQECKIDFEARLIIDTDGNIASDGTSLSVSDASYATVYVSGASNFVDYKTLGDTNIRTERNDLVISKIYDGSKFIKTYDDIKAANTADYRELFDRNSLHISDWAENSSEQQNKTTDERIAEFNLFNDLSLVNLYYNYAKYLVISSSRANDGLNFGKLSDGTTDVIAPAQPANLQGLWNNEYAPNWQSKYTINVNIEMIYSLSQIANMNETEIPFFNAIEEIAENGHNTAIKTYGIGADNSAWVIHHNFDIWRGTAPVDMVKAGQWPTGGLWLTYHLWERYLYSGDEEFLRDTVYPTLKGCIDFLNGYMAEAEGKDGNTYLVSPVSISPEHESLQVGPAMDHQMIRQTFRSAIKASEILGVDEELRAEWEETLSRVAPDFISSKTFNSKNYLQEWFYDIDPTDDAPSYSHTNQLWGLYPGVETTAYDNDEYEQSIFDAYKTSLERRMSGTVKNGWALAWRQALSARAAMGNEAYKMYRTMMTDFTAPNMLDLIMPYHSSFTNVFQLDANIGGASATAEMLVQSHDGAITILPALPEVWKNGEIKGLMARGGYSVDMTWKDNSPEKVSLTASETGTASIRYMNGVENVSVECDGEPVDVTLSDDRENVFTFSTDAGKTYDITGFTKCEINKMWLSEDNADMYVYKTKQLTPGFSNDDIKTDDITYTSSDNSVAEVDLNGVVTAKKAGKAVITAAADGGAYSAQCTINVVDLPSDLVYYDVDGGKIVFDKQRGEVTDYVGDITDLKIPSIIDGTNVIKIAPYAFEDLTSLDSVEISRSTTHIAEGAFKGCTSLKTAVIPDTVSIIGEGAFEGCISLSDITIPESVTKLADNCFNGCDGLSSVMFRGGAPDMAGNNIFPSQTVVKYNRGADGFTSPTWMDYNSEECDGTPMSAPKAHAYVLSASKNANETEVSYRIIPTAENKEITVRVATAIYENGKLAGVSMKDEIISDETVESSIKYDGSEFENDGKKYTLKTMIWDNDTMKPIMDSYSQSDIDFEVKTLYNSELDFNAKQGPVWYYQSTSDFKTFTDMQTYVESSGLWNGGYTYLTANGTNLHPHTKFPTRTFVAPRTGEITINESVVKTDASGTRDGVGVRILKTDKNGNVTTVYPTDGSEYLLIENAEHIKGVTLPSVSLSIEQGEKLHFILDDGEANDNGRDGTYWVNEVEYTSYE